MGSPKIKGKRVKMMKNAELQAAAVDQNYKRGKGKALNELQRRGVALVTETETETE